MEFLWSGWLALSIPIYGLLILIGINSARRHSLKRAIIPLLAIALAFNGVVFLVSKAGGIVPNSVSAVGAARFMGLESGKEYPIQIGSRVDGSAGNGYFYGGIFGSGGAIDMRVASSVNMGFASGQSRYILQVPMDKITFEQSGSGESSAQIFLQWRVDNQEFGFYDQRCTPVVQSLILTHSCELVLDQEPDGFDKVRRRGLGSIVIEYVDGVIVKLSPEVYEQLLGTP